MELAVVNGHGNGDGGGRPPSHYTLPPGPFFLEDILFCIDVDQESMTEAKPPSSATPSGAVPRAGRPVTRLDVIKHAILFFVHSKLAINSGHAFSFSFFAHSASRPQKEFTSDVESVNEMLAALKADASYDRADLTPLFRLATQQAKKSRSMSRMLRVILIYCRSSTIPEHHWPVNDQRHFTLDVVYLHNKPSDDNCPQKVYDALVDALEQVSDCEGYIFENKCSQRALFKQMCILLAHPQQRCMQEDIDFPKTLVKKVDADEAPRDLAVVPASNESVPNDS